MKTHTRFTLCAPMCLHKHTCTHTCMYTCTHVHACMHARPCMHAHTCTNTQTRTQTHVHAHALTLTCTHAVVVFFWGGGDAFSFFQGRHELLIRISKLVPFKALHILLYFHVKCAFELFRKARLATNVIANINDLDGYGKLGNRDKSLIKELIEKGNAARLKPLPQEPYTRYIKSLQILPKLGKENLVSSQVPAIQVMFTNADQLTSSKMFELLKLVEQKPLIITICEVKSKNAKERSVKDYEIPGYSMHPVNLDLEGTGRGIDIYTHSSLDNSVTLIQPDLSFDEACGDADAARFSYAKARNKVTMMRKAKRKQKKEIKEIKEIKK